MGTRPESDLIAIAFRRWRVLLIGAILGTAAAITYAFLATPWYEARLAVVPAQRGHEAAALTLAAKIPGLDTVSADSKRIEAVLTSYSVTDEVITRFNLGSHYGASAPERAREALWSHCSTNVDRKSGVVALTCEDTDPQLVTDVVRYFGEVGNRVFNRISASSAKEEENFLKTQLEKAHNDVVAAATALRDFQEKHKIVDLPEQSKAVISAMASIQGDLLSKQLELSYLSGFSGRGEASVVQLQQQIAIMQSKLKELEAGTARSQPRGEGSASVFPGVLTVPELRFELEQLIRNQKIREAAFLLMTQRYELARIESARDTSSFQILDQPAKPMVRSRPKRRKLAILGFVVGIAAASIWILAPIWLRRIRAVAS
jgi:tyrosine-protein kinase Etk/Wzc